MPIKYRLVLRKDMTKGAAAGSKLYYAVNKSTGTCDFEELCDQIADRSTASRGDVHVVVDGLLYILKQRLQKGETVQLGDLGHFQAVIGSKGTKLESDFNASLIKRPRIVFRPSVTLKSVTSLVQVREDRARRTRPGRKRQRIPRRNLNQGSPRCDTMHSRWRGDKIRWRGCHPHSSSRSINFPLTRIHRDSLSEAFFFDNKGK